MMHRYASAESYYHKLQQKSHICFHFQTNDLDLGCPIIFALQNIFILTVLLQKVGWGCRVYHDCIKRLAYLASDPYDPLSNPRPKAMLALLNVLLTICC